MQNVCRTLVLFFVTPLALAACGCGRMQDSENVEAAPTSQVDAAASTTNQPTAPQVFTLVLPDGREARIAPDLSQFQGKSSDVSIHDIQHACERAVIDPKQEGVPLRDRTIRVLVGVRSAYFDGKKWVRYKHEPEPIFEAYKLGYICTLEISPPRERKD